MNHPLYEITNRYKQAVHDLDGLELDKEVIADTLNSIEGEIDEKIQSVVAYTLNLQAELNGVESARKRMQDREKSLSKKIEWLKKYVADNMLAVGINQVSTHEFKVSLRKCPDKVEIINELEIPSIYKTAETVYQIDKKMIKDSGGCPGAKIVNSYTLSIK